MASSGTNHVVAGAEATIEIKIKTLDSQTYTLRVDKQVTSPMSFHIIPAKIFL